MRIAIRHIVTKTYKPLLGKYLSKTRVYNYEGIKLEIPPQVFHPGFFTSTQLLLNYIRQFPLKGKKILEPGCGSGLISIYTAKRGAIVTASDINPVAVEYLKKNSAQNKVILSVIESDLFEKIPMQQFDIIAINPPYYKKNPRSLIDHAWYCGENGEYFEKLFYSLHNYINNESNIYMVLCDGCDLQMINSFADKNNLKLQCVLTKKSLIEKNFVYKIETV